MGKYIDKTYLTSLWGRIKQIPEQVSYTIDNASKTLVSAINDLYTGKANKEHTHLKSSIMDFPTSLPANGGNADTLDGKHADAFALANSSFTKDESYIYNGKRTNVVTILGGSGYDIPAVYKVYISKANISNIRFSFKIISVGEYTFRNGLNEDIVEYEGEFLEEESTYTGGITVDDSGYWNYTRRLALNDNSKTSKPLFSDICYDSERKQFFVYVGIPNESKIKFFLDYIVTDTRYSNYNIELGDCVLVNGMTLSTQFANAINETVSLDNNRNKYDSIVRSLKNVGSNAIYASVKYPVYSSTPVPTTLSDYNITDACSKADFTVLNTQINGTNLNDNNSIVALQNQQQTDINNLKNKFANTIILKVKYLNSETPDIIKFVESIRNNNV